MIERLRKRFIRIATLAVAGVLLLLCVTVNTANYISADRQLTAGASRGRSPTAPSRPKRRIPRATSCCAMMVTAISSRRI